MAETLTKAQILMAKEDGAEVEFENDKLRTIDGFDNLIVQIKNLVEVQRANAGADMLRSEANSELIAVLRKMLSMPARKIDASPLESVLESVIAMKRDVVSYRFNLNRDNRGFLKEIVATPVLPEDVTVTFRDQA